MNGRKILAAIFLLLAMASGYMTWLMGRAGDDGKWLFGVFAIFFLLLTVAPLVPEFKKKLPPEPSPNTRFGPHWYMMGAALVLVGCIILGLIAAIRAILQ